MVNPPPKYRFVLVRRRHLRQRQLLRSGGGVKVGRFVRYPSDKFRNGSVAKQRLTIRAAARQFGIGEIGVDRLVADRMDRDGFATLLGLRHGVMPLQPSRNRA